MIVAGFGFRTSASADSLRDALARAAGEQKVSALATLSDKARSNAFQDFALDLGLPVHALDAEALGGRSLRQLKARMPAPRERAEASPRRLRLRRRAPGPRSWRRA